MTMNPRDLLQQRPTQTQNDIPAHKNVPIHLPSHKIRTNQVSWEKETVDFMPIRAGMFKCVQNNEILTTKSQKHDHLVSVDQNMNVEEEISCDFDLLEPHFVIEDPTIMVSTMSFGHDNNKLYVGTMDGHIWEVCLTAKKIVSEEPLYKTDLPIPVNSIAVSRDNILIAGFGSGLLVTKDVSNPASHFLERQFDVSITSVAAPRYDKSGLFGVGDSAGLIYFFDPTTQRAVQCIQGHVGAVSSLDISHCGALMLSSGCDGHCRLWCLRTTVCLKTYLSTSVDCPPSVSKILFEPTSEKDQTVNNEVEHESAERFVSIANFGNQASQWHLDDSLRPAQHFTPCPFQEKVSLHHMLDGVEISSNFSMMRDAAYMGQYLLTTTHEGRMVGWDSTTGRYMINEDLLLAHQVIDRATVTWSDVLFNVVKEKGIPKHAADLMLQSHNTVARVLNDWRKFDGKVYTQPSPVTSICTFADPHRPFVATGAISAKAPVVVWKVKTHDERVRQILDDEEIINAYFENCSCKRQECVNMHMSFTQPNVCRVQQEHKHVNSDVEEGDDFAENVLHEMRNFCEMTRPLTKSFYAETISERANVHYPQTHCSTSHYLNSYPKPVYPIIIRASDFEVKKQKELRDFNYAVFFNSNLSQIKARTEHVSTMRHSSTIKKSQNDGVAPLVMSAKQMSVNDVAFTEVDFMSAVYKTLLSQSAEWERKLNEARQDSQTNSVKPSFPPSSMDVVKLVANEMPLGMRDCLEVEHVRKGVLALTLKHQHKNKKEL